MCRISRLFQSTISDQLHYICHPQMETTKSSTDFPWLEPFLTSSYFDDTFPTLFEFLLLPPFQVSKSADRGHLRSDCSGWPCSATLHNNNIRPKMFRCFWSNTLELTPTVCSWSITDTDSVLYTFEDCVILQSIYKKLIRRWDSERKLSLRWHRTCSTKYNRSVHKFRHRSTRLYVGTQVYQILWNNAM